MNANVRQLLLPAILVGGLLLTPGCSTPTVTVGTPAQADRTVLHVRSAIPTQVQCVWLQDGASIEQSGKTPFRLVFSGRAVQSVTLFKSARAADVVVEIRPPGAEPSRFVMGHGSSGMKLMRDNRHWEGRIF